MQVLGWQCRLLHKHALEYESVHLSSEEDFESEDTSVGSALPPAPHMVSGSPLDGATTLSSEVRMAQAGIVLAGFRDCSEEAIRYLVDVEHMSEEDPLIVGLKQHLWQRQQQLDVEGLLAFHANSAANSASEEESLYSGVSSINGCHPDSRTVLTSSPSVSPATSSVSSTLESSTNMTDMASSSLSPHSDTHMDEVDTHPIAEASTPSMLTALSPRSHTGSPDTVSETHTQRDTDSSNILSLALLAQNNPAIASLTEELISLLEQSQDSESDLDVEEPNESTTESAAYSD